MLKLAYRFMIYDKPKTLGALLGVILSIFLIGQQTGIFIFLTNAMAALVDNTQTDLWVVDERTTNVSALGQIDTRIGREIESLPGVAKAHPLVIAGASCKFANGKNSGVQLIGAQPPLFRGGPWRLAQGSTTDLLPEGAVCYDYFEHKNLGNSELGDYFEIGGKRVYLAAQTKGARGFGGIYMFSTIDRVRYLSKYPANKVSAFLIDLQPGADPRQVRDAINRSFVGIRAWIPKDFSKATIITVLSSSGIAISVGTLVVFAIISGLVIIGLTLYSSAIDRLRDYGTMKAIGASNGYISRLIYTQAVIVAIIGFCFSMVLVEGFRNGIANAGTLFDYPAWLRLSFFLLTLLLSLGGAFFAVRRIVKVEPASVFRG
jgi:putative ABC transport system permease protein